MASHNETGKIGEQLAFEWIKKQGYHIVRQNWRFGHWEIDLVATKENTLHFFEIKTRKGKSFGNPEDRGDKKKLHIFISAGTEYLRLYPIHKWICFNILAITILSENEIEYFLLEDVYY